ncbi:MAG: NAD(P)H-binding protein, partial [Gemmatimonadales bacterium]|nr:NAD(P)H-binding protein [Gemmatimonadales bacterium]
MPPAPPRATPPRQIFLTGGTGYMGRRLAERLVARGHAVRALARAGSEARLPGGVEVVQGDALHGISYAARVAPAETFIHLVGVSHPSPAKAQQFLSVDLASVAAAVPAAVTAGVRHFIYVSVAHPAPLMQAYIAARVRAEAVIRDSGLPATILRPWYVLGPGHWWPVLLSPLYALGRVLPPTREGARRLGLVTLDQMLAALVAAVEAPADGWRVVDVPHIQRSR